MKWRMLELSFFIPTHSQFLISFLNFSIHTFFHFFYSLMLKGGTRNVTGWVLLTGFYDDTAPMGLLWFYPERSRGVRFVIYQISRLGFARRTVFMRRRVLTERSRGVGCLCNSFSSRLRSTNSFHAKASTHRAELKNSPRPTGTPLHKGNEIHLLYYSFLSRHRIHGRCMMRKMFKFC